jgi:hypothetical protein
VAAGQLLSATLEGVRKPVWQLDSCYQTGWTGGEKIYSSAASGTHQNLAAGLLLLTRLYFKRKPYSNMQLLKELIRICGSWSAVIGQDILTN